MTQITLKDFEPKNWQEISQLEKSTDDVEIPASENDFLHYYDTGKHLAKVICFNNKIVGYMLYKLETQLLTVDWLFVDSRYRRQGIAFFAVETLLSQLKGLRRTAVAAEVSEKNLAAQLLLKKTGFSWFRTLEADVSRYAFLFPKEVIARLKEPVC